MDLEVEKEKSPFLNTTSDFEDLEREIELGLNEDEDLKREIELGLNEDEEMMEIDNEKQSIINEIIREKSELEEKRKTTHDHMTSKKKEAEIEKNVNMKKRLNAEFEKI